MHVRQPARRSRAAKDVADGSGRRLRLSGRLTRKSTARPVSAFDAARTSNLNRPASPTGAVRFAASETFDGSAPHPVGAIPQAAVERRLTFPWYWFDSSHAS